MNNVIQNINSIMRTLICAILLVFLPLQALALEEIPLHVRQTDVSAKRGSHNSVFAAARDSDGYMWLATPPGLYVYDGHLARPVLEDILQGTRIRDLHIDSGDTLWVATNSGVLTYALKSGKYRWHRATDGQNGLIGDTTHAIYEDKRGTLWVGTANGSLKNGVWQGPAYAGLHRYEPSFDRFELVEAIDLGVRNKASVLDICEDRNRDMWVATDQGLYRLTGNQGPATYIPLSTGAAYSAKKVACDGAGNIWISMSHQGLWTLSSHAARPELVKVNDITAGHILDVYADSEGDVWFCTNKGLFRYAHREARFYRHPFIFENQPARELEFVASVRETSSRSLWIGTIDLGVLHWAAHPGAAIIELASGEATKSQRIQDVNEVVTGPDSRVYFGAKKGGLYRSTESLTSSRLILSPKLAVEPFLKDLQVKALARAGEFLLCGVQNALLRIDAQGNVQRVQAMPDPQNVFHDMVIAHIAPVPDGRVWFASKFALHSWTPGTASARLEMMAPGNQTIKSMTYAAEAVWFGQDSRISKIDPVSGRQTLLDIPAKVWADQATLKTLMVEDPGTIWIGTTKNVFRFNPGSGTLTTIVTTGQSSIPSALSFLPDNLGNTWIHTQEKVFVIAPGSNLAMEALLGAGHPSVSISAPPALLPDASFVYGHSGGLLLIDPPRLLERPPSAPKISEVRVFGQPLPASPTGRTMDSLNLEYRQNYLTFSFSMPEPMALHRPRFFYFLEGVDTTWNDSGFQSTVSYAHIEPGRYVLHVKDGHDATAIASMGITIREPWWMTAWARTGYALALVLAMLAASRLFARVQTTRIRKEMLENLVMQDPLTEVPNRRKFKEVLAAEKSRCKRSNHQISVLMIDIDFFKGFNDRFGHQAGDKALRKVAQTVSEALRRPEDFMARFGGEEFVVVLPSTNREGAERVAEKIQSAIHQTCIPYPGSPLSDRITLSIGISTFSPQTDLHIDSGLFSADQALYQAKRNGRNCIFYKDHCLSLTPMRQ